MFYEIMSLITQFIGKTLTGIEDILANIPMNCATEDVYLKWKY